MLLTLTTTRSPATDLGYLLAKNPARAQSFSLAFGEAHVFYPQADADVCTAALLLELDPVGLVRGRAPGEAPLAAYVNDRPYVASSFLSVAIARVFRSALKGSNKDRPELPATVLPLEAHVPVLPCRGGEALLRRLFEPLGYQVVAEALPLDTRFPQWGPSPYFALTLTHRCTLQALLSHLYVLLPVLDNDKHYWVGEDEVDKLLAHGEPWLSAHPERDAIVARYLRQQRSLMREAAAQLTDEGGAEPEAQETRQDQREAALEQALSLNETRQRTVAATLMELGARRVLDVGCGEGRLLQALLKEPSITHVAGMDVSPLALQRAHKRLKVEEMPSLQRHRLELFQGALTYRDERLSGYDAACAIEVIEHMDPGRLQAFERVLFEFARPRAVIITTPNVAYNARFSGLAPGQLRHPDHRFEWTQSQFETWAQGVAERTGYSVRFSPIGPLDDALGAPTQMAVFTS